MIKTKRSLGESLYWAYLGLNIILLAFFGVFVRYKTAGMYVKDWLCFPNIAAFCLLGGLLIFLLRGSKRLSLGRIALLLMLWIALLFAYDYSAVEAWIDARADLETAHNLQQLGLSTFMQDYHKQTAFEILRSPSLQKKLDSYDRWLPFYSVRARLEAQTQDFTLLEANRTGHHPPFYFMLLAAWLQLGSSVFALKVFAKVLYAVFLISIFFLLRYLLQKRDLALKGSLIVGLMPALLFASQAPKSDLLLGSISAWIVLMLCHFSTARQASRSPNEKSNNRYFGMLCHFSTARQATRAIPIWQHLVLGLLLTLAIFSKFTALLILLPILAIYLFLYRWQAWKPLLALAIPIIIIPLLLQLISGYDILLNIVTGRIIQDEWIAENTSPIRFLFQRVLFGQFRVGLPVILIIPFALLSILIPKFQALKTPSPHNSQFSILNSQFSSNSQSSILNSQLSSNSQFSILNSQLSSNSQSSILNSQLSSNSQFSILNSQLSSNSQFSILNSQLKPHSTSYILHSKLTIPLLLFYLSIYFILWGSSVDRHQIGFLPFALPFIFHYLPRIFNSQFSILNSQLSRNSQFSILNSQLSRNSPFSILNSQLSRNSQSSILNSQLSRNSQFSILNSQLKPHSQLNFLHSKLATLLLIYNLLFISYSLSDNHIDSPHLIPFETTTIIP